jgi:HlyD family secretion protein
MKQLFNLLMASMILGSVSCKKQAALYDASGTFEAEETIISAEATGVIKQFDVEEGQQLNAGQLVGYIDTTQLFLKKQQLKSQVSAVLSRKPDIPVQLASLKEQLRTAEREKTRITNLVSADAATTKQLDDANAQTEVIKKQISALESSLQISSSGISKDATPVEIQIAQLNDQLIKSRIINPFNGTVLTKYAEANEMAAPGKPLYKIADLSTIILRAYITGDQLPLIKLNQHVKVLTDNDKGGYNETTGVITWISSKAEFTPKTIQTKDERANLVYAIKIDVKNNGYYKIGMYGEVKL